MKWWGAIWQFILAIFTIIIGNRKEDGQATQETQDQIVEEAQHEINQIPGKTDAELDQQLIDLGVVQSEPDSPDRVTKDPSRSFRPGNDYGPGSYTGSKASSKTKKAVD